MGTAALGLVEIVPGELNLVSPPRTIMAMCCISYARNDANPLGSTERQRGKDRSRQSVRSTCKLSAPCIAEPA